MAVESGSGYDLPQNFSSMDSPISSSSPSTSMSSTSPGAVSSSAGALLPVVPGAPQPKRPSLLEVATAMKHIVDWEAVAEQLNFEASAILTIRRFPLEEQKRQMIMKWLQTDRSATMEKLERAIANANQSCLGVEYDSGDTEPLLMNIARIKHEFSKLLQEVRTAIDSGGVEVDVKEVREYLIGVFQCDIPNTNFADMFVAVTARKLWTYQNYYPLENFVRLYLRNKTCMVTEYKNCLSGFHVTIKIIDYIQNANPPLTNVDEEGSTDIFSKKVYNDLKVKLKLKRPLSELSMKYVDELWSDFVEEFGLPNLTAVIHKIRTGSLEIIWLNFLHVTKMIAVSAHESIPFFRDHSIVYVAVDGHPVYDESLTELLFEASTRGDWRRVKSLLEDKDDMININFLNHDGKPLLTLAAEGGHELVTLALLQSGSELDFQQEMSGKTALFFASENGHDAMVAILLAFGANPLLTDKTGETPFGVAKKKGNHKVCEEFELLESSKSPAVRSISMQQQIAEALEGFRHAIFCTFFQAYHLLTSDIVGATKDGDIQAVKHMLEEKENVQALIESKESNKHGWTALMWACERGSFELVELLLCKGANPNDVAKFKGWTSLLLASRRGYLKIVKILLDHGADPNGQNEMGISPLAISLYERHSAVALVLIQREANVNLADKNGWTPLSRASNEGNLKLVRVILDHEAKLNSVTEEGWTSLMLASNHGHTEVVEELARRGAQCNLTTAAGDSALHIASLRNLPDIVTILSKAKANLNTTNKDGLTPLMVATNRNYVEVVDALLEGGADINFPHKTTKWTAIFFAAKNGNIEMVRKFLYQGAHPNLSDGTSLSDVASQLKHMQIVDVIGTSVDYAPIPEGQKESKDATDYVSTGNYLEKVVKALDRRVSNFVNKVNELL